MESASTNTAAGTDAAPRENIPDTWPGAFGIYKYSCDVVKRNSRLLASLWASYLIIDIVLSVVSPSSYGAVRSVVNLMVGTVVTVMITEVLLAGLRGRQISSREVLSGDLPSLSAKLFVLEILTSLTILVSFMLLIVPAFFVIPRLMLAPYFLIDKGIGPMEAFSASWNATRGSAGKVWGVIGTTILMVLLMITIIGIPIAIYLLFMYSAAPAVLYAFLLRHNETATQNLPKQG